VIRVAALSLTAAVLAAGCGGGWSGPAGTQPPVARAGSVAPASTAVVLPASTPVAPTPTALAPTPRPTEVPGPPGATLAAGGATVDGGPAPGELGTFTWAGLVSDAPWVVPPPAGAVTGAGPFTVTFDPAMPVERWTAAWARVTADVAGSPTDGGGSTGSAVSIEPPPVPGTWGLQVHAWFGPGRHATWYWRVEVRP